MSKAKETTALSPSVGADGGQPSKTYTPISEDTADRFRSDLSLKPHRATMRDGCDGVFGGGSFTVAPSRKERRRQSTAFWNKGKTKSEVIV